MSDYTLSSYRAKKLRSRLKDWYVIHRRFMPWRETSDPYKIWLSEIILQQTRVAQGTSYYLRFTTTFPTVRDLASATQDEVLKLWEGLGYYSRARNMHRAAKYITHELSSVFPEQYQTLLELPGVGPYTAAAISSICYDEKRAVVDGNVVRVLSRLMGIPFRYDRQIDRTIYDQLASTLLPSVNIGDHNQAMMELGATVCTPRKVQCADCPWSYGCIAYKHKMVELYPPAKVRLIKKTRHFHYLLIQSRDQLIIRQRMKSDIWQGLYELPYIEQEPDVDTDQWNTLYTNLGLKIKQKPEPIIMKPLKQTLSHQIIVAHFYIVSLKGSLASGQRKTSKGVHLIKNSAISDYAYPRILNHFFEEQIISKTHDQ